MFFISSTSADLTMGRHRIGSKARSHKSSYGHIGSESVRADERRFPPIDRSGVGRKSMDWRRRSWLPVAIYRVLTFCCLFIVLSLLGLPATDMAHADWGEVGAQYSCNTTNGTFELLPYDQSSSDPPEGIPARRGFKVLPDGTTTVSCRLGKRKLEAQIRVTPPQPRGMCMGGGAVSVMSLVVDGVELLDTYLAFDGYCAGEPIIVRVLLRAKPRGVELTRCAQDSAAAAARGAEAQCASDSVNTDLAAAKNALRDHALADVQTQKATSALKLPPSDDLATLVPASPNAPDVPLCAHWSDIFLDAVTDKEFQWHGRVAGINGERVWIHPTSPLLCHDNAEDGCAPTAYVLPGDSVDVGFICGNWTYVQYETHVRSKPGTSGWIETQRLYGISKGRSADTAAEQQLPAVSDGTATDPLVQAVKDADLAKVRNIVTSGESPNGRENVGAPIAAAVRAGNTDAVKLLLTLGADSKPHFQDGGCRDLISDAWTLTGNSVLQNTDLLAVLVKAGADVNCRSRGWLTTALMNASGSDRIQQWHMIQHHGHAGQHLNDAAVFAARLLSAGADPNLTNVAGQTALFYTAESNNVDAAAVLLASGANPNVSIDGMGEQEFGSLASQEGSTPLMTAYHWYSLTHDPTLIGLLLDHGADPNYRNKSDYDAECDETTQGACTFEGQTVLTRAAEDGSYTVVKLLIDHGADLRVPRSDGALPAELASDHVKVAQLIQEYADRNKNSIEAVQGSGP